MRGGLVAAWSLYHNGYLYHGSFRVPLMAAAALVQSGTSSPDSNSDPRTGLSIFLQCISSNHRYGQPGPNSDLLSGEFGPGLWKPKCLELLLALEQLECSPKSRDPHLCRTSSRVSTLRLGRKQEELQADISLGRSQPLCQY